MARRFADLPEALAATGEIAARCRFTLEDLGYRFPDYPAPDGRPQIAYLRELVEAGARGRYRPVTTRVRQQLARELALIEKLALAGYFLIVWDIVREARARGILVQGRGSAANSAVCYSLGITAVDPVGMDLLFERFLSEERGEWPDIDLDLPSGDRREAIIQYVYGRYGGTSAAMTANVITYQPRRAVREVGKALGLPPDFLDRLAKGVPGWGYQDPDEEAPARHLARAGADLADARIRRFARLWHAVVGLPRHLGQHSGGMVLCAGRLDEVVPLEPATMPGRVVVQWDKDDCADLGIIKVDLLGLGMMAALEEAIALCRAAGREVDLAHLPPDDPAVYQLLQAADTVGLFQVESRAQMATLPRLKPRRFYDLVVQIAIIRPGPIIGQMVHPYLARRAGRQPVVYPASLARAHPPPDARRAAVPGAAPPDGDGRRGAHRRRGRGAPPGLRVPALARPDAGDRGEAPRRDRPERDHRPCRRGDRARDHRVRGVRLSRVARGELRAARLRERVPQGPPPGRVLRGAPQQPADGLLPSGDGRAGCAPPRPGDAAGGRRRLGLARDGRGRRRAARPRAGEGAPRGGGGAARGRAAGAALRLGGRPLRAGRALAGRGDDARRGGRAGEPRAPAPRRALAGRAGGAAAGPALRAATPRRPSPRRSARCR